MRAGRGRVLLLPEAAACSVFQEELSRQLQYVCLYLLHVAAPYLLK